MVGAKRVAIIGGGISGISSLKETLQQGLSPIVFEKSSTIGGLWNHEHGSTWASMRAILSKYFVSFSDFPWPSDMDILPKPSDVEQYLHDYISHFNLQPYIKCNTKVISASQLESNNSWLVKWEDLETNEIHEEPFEFLIVATGLFNDPYIPDYQNINQFKGEVLHSKYYKNLDNVKNFDDKKAIVVGHSFSGAQICADLSNRGAKVLNIIKRPYWILTTLMNLNPESSLPGLPCDLIFFNRKAIHYQNQLPILDQNVFMNNMYSKVCFEQNNYPALYIDPNSTEPPRAATSMYYMKNVKQGKIIPTQQKIKSFTENGVVLEDGTIEQADIVILATGYHLHLPFLDEKIKEKLQYDVNDAIQPLVLYKATIHPDVSNFAFIGMFSAVPEIEIQAKWVSLLFSGKQKLPSKQEFEVELEKERQIRSMPTRGSLVRDFVSFPDSIAKEIGLLPDFDEISKSDPELYKALWEGPHLTLHYILKDNKEFCLKVMKEIEEDIKRRTES